MGETLKPCPFCGRTDIWSAWADCDDPGMEDCGYWSTGCAACGLEFHRDDQEEAEAAWNDRAPDPAAEARGLERAAKHDDLMAVKIRGTTPTWQAEASIFMESAQDHRAEAAKLKEGKT